MEKNTIEQRAKDNQEVFINQLLEDFESHPNFEGGNLKDFADYLVNRKVISPRNQLRYLACSLYPKILLQNGNRKTKAIAEIETKYDIPSRTIGGWITKKKQTFPIIRPLS